jgi:hypothetical protein
MTLKTKIAVIFSMILVMTVITPAGNSGLTNVSAGGYCDWVQFVADVTIPDGLPVDPGIALKKTWRLKNIGTCWWNKSYKLVFVGGEPMGGVTAVNLPKDVAPGQTIDLTIGLTAPTAPGTYIGYWQLQNPSGGLFGIGQTAGKPFFVEIEVVSKAPPVFDFVAQAPFTNWRTEATGKRPFPGFYGDPAGFVMAVNNPILENGISSTAPGLLMAPPVEYNEHIFGVFPAYKIKPGDRFQAIIGCEYGSRDCDVTFVLQYKIEGVGIRSFWSIRKTYKNSFTRINLNLNPLADKTVEFILLVRPNGSTTGDNAMWANPVVVNSLQPAPVVPTITPQSLTPVPTISTLPPTTTYCDRATFIADVNVPDGTVFNPGQPFTKTWRFRNTGKCTWTTDYALVFSTGDQMGGASSINLPAGVAPGETVDISVNLTAPANAGSYRGYWLFKNAQGGLFGIGTQANKPFWLAISVTGSLPPTTANGYDFVAHACEAQWTSGAGALSCPNQTVSNGSILIVNNPRLENNTVDARPALLTVPQFVYNGYIQGVFPPFAVQASDRFRSIVNCEYLQRDCYVVFRLDYQIDNGPIQNFWAFGERYEGSYYQADIDLSPLAGKNVKFILRADANGSPTGDRAVWVAPSIVRSGGPVTAVPSATPLPVTTTSTPVPVTPTLTLIPTFTVTLPPPVNSGQLTYTNTRYGFQFQYPASSVVTALQDAYARMNFSIIQGTNLVEKYLEVTVFENLASCTSPLTSGYAPGSFESTQVTSITGISFTKESGQQGAAGQIYDWVAYSTTKGTACISLGFVLHSANPLNFPVPPPLFNKDVESSVFLDIVSSLGWMNP